MSEEELVPYLKEVTDFKNSYVVLLNNKIVGCYLLNEGDVSKYTEVNNDPEENFEVFEDLSKYKIKKVLKELLWHFYHNIEIKA